MWLIVLSDQLPIVALVGHYPTNQLIGRRLIFRRLTTFLIAASRRSRGRVSVPVWLVILSDQLPVVALVGRDPTN